MNTLRIAGVVFTAILLVSTPVWQDGSAAGAMIDICGIVLLLTAVLGRIWTLAYIGGRKNRVLVTTGPYSVTRNPLYVFSTMAAAGIGLLFGSILLAVLLAAFVGAVLHRTSRREAAFLQMRFGTQYARYALRVPLFWPNPRLYRDAPELRISPGGLYRPIGDTLLLLLAIPAAALVVQLKSLWLLPRFLPVF